MLKQKFPAVSAGLNWQVSYIFKEIETVFNIACFSDLVITWFFREIMGPQYQVVNSEFRRWIPKHRFLEKQRLQICRGFLHNKLDLLQSTRHFLFQIQLPEWDRRGSFLYWENSPTRKDKKFQFWLSGRWSPK